MQYSSVNNLLEQTIIVSAEVKNDITHNKPSDQNGQPKESDEDEAQDDDNSQEELIVAQENQADGQNTELSTTEKEEIENLYEKSTKEETTQEEPEQESSIHEPDSDSGRNLIIVVFWAVMAHGIPYDSHTIRIEIK